MNPRRWFPVDQADRWTPDTSPPITASSPVPRIESLDYLRGLMALSVMVYHYTLPLGDEPGSESLLARLGCYAVSVFYILSGLSLTLVYRGRIHNRSDATRFWVKRLLRICPLYWLAITVSLLYQGLATVLLGESWDVSSLRILLNYSLLFGFFDPGGALTTGGWSIGNEVVFYAVLPCVLWLSNRWRAALAASLAAALALAGAFSLVWMSPERTLVEQWPVYINPLNQFVYFMLGVAIGHASFSRPQSRWSLAAGLGAAVCAAAFCLWPLEGDRIHLVTGMSRLAFTGMSAAVVVAFIHLRPLASPLLCGSLAFLGRSCYSIYLLHPLVALPIVFVGTRLGLALYECYLLSAAMTFACSWASYRYVEEPCIKLASRLTRQRSQVPASPQSRETELPLRSDRRAA